MNQKKYVHVFLILIILFSVGNISYAINNPNDGLQRPYYYDNGSWKTSRYLSIFTFAASNTTKNSTVLNGTINKNNYPATVYFEYGTSPDLSTFTETNQKFFNSINELTEFSDIAKDLLPNTTYYFRAVGKNYTNIMKGKIFSFTTLNADGTKVVEITPKIEEPVPVVEQTKVVPEIVKKEKTGISTKVIIYGAIVLVLIFVLAFIIAKRKAKQRKW